ncbi:MAG: type I 3-dehydroquinate dehydratase [Agathobacter sp.]|nr:type I 3-dehydroquinate dehydratase [Agathobacter sp.]
MKKLMIKGRVIGEGRPLVCVPIMETSRQGILAEAKRLAENKTEMVEWRVDAFEEVNSLNAVREVLQSLGEIFTETIFVYTFRSKAQGGLLELDEESIADLREVAAESKVVDLVDLEFFASENSSREISKLQKMGVAIIASHHDFEQTPDKNTMEILLEKMLTGGADIVKLAVMPQSRADVLSLLEVTSEFKENYPKAPVITMSMGAIGGISRIAGEYFGSCVTFGAGIKASAPGQIDCKQLETILDILHESIS